MFEESTNSIWKLLNKAIQQFENEQKLNYLEAKHEEVLKFLERKKAEEKNIRNLINSIHELSGPILVKMYSG